MCFCGHFFAIAAGKTAFSAQSVAAIAAGVPQKADFLQSRPGGAGQGRNHGQGTEPEGTGPEGAGGNLQDFVYLCTRFIE